MGQVLEDSHIQIKNTKKKKPINKKLTFSATNEKATPTSFQHFAILTLLYLGQIIAAAGGGGGAVLYITDV